MASDGGGGGSSKGLAGKKRKAAAGGRGETPARREPRRGLGVAALESIRGQLEKAENFYMFPPLSTAAAAAAPPPPPPPLPSLVGHVPSVRFNPYVGSGSVQRDYYHQYYGAQHYTLPRFLQASNGHGVPRDQNLQVGHNVVDVVATAPPVEQQDHRRRARQQHEKAKRPLQVAFVDLVDSDDDDAAAAVAGEEELDLELKL